MFFAADSYYVTASDAGIVHLPEGTQVTVAAQGGTYDTPTNVSATLVNTDEHNAPINNESVTLAVNGTTQACTATTDTFGVATLQHHPERAGWDLLPDRVVPR